MNLLRLALLIVLSSFALNVDAAQTVDLYDGTIEVPDGYTHTTDPGDDTDCGHLASPDGKLVIHYDLGTNAGFMTDSYLSGAEYSESRVSSRFKAGDLTALMVSCTHRYNDGTRHLEVMISFLEPKGINFYATINDKEDVDIVRRIVMTFRPAKQKPTTP